MLRVKKNELSNCGEFLGRAAEGDEMWAALLREAVCVKVRIVWLRRMAVPLFVLDLTTLIPLSRGIMRTF